MDGNGIYKYGCNIFYSRSSKCNGRLNFCFEYLLLPKYTKIRNQMKNILRSLLWVFPAISILMSGTVNSETLLQAVQQKDPARVEELLRGQTDPNHRDAYGVTALMVAAELGDLRSVRALLAANAAIDLSGNNQWTALMLATYGGHTHVVRALLDAGADISLRNGIGAPPLMIATFRGHEDIVNMLLRKNADVNARKNDNGTSLIWAAHEGHRKIVSLLLEAGAEVNAANDNGQTALSMARDKAHGEIEKMLLSKISRE